MIALRPSPLLAGLLAFGCATDPKDASDSGATETEEPDLPPATDSGTDDTYDTSYYETR